MIVFGRARIEEYFDVVNINNYDIILGTLFLRRLRVALDFMSPGVVCMGTAVVPCNFPLGLPDEKAK